MMTHLSASRKALVIILSVLLSANIILAYCAYHNFFSPTPDPWSAYSLIINVIFATASTYIINWLVQYDNQQS
jgi:hypothetical protein